MRAIRLLAALSLLLAMVFTVQGVAPAADWDHDVSEANGNDVVIGRAGNDTFYGGIGFYDYCSGGSGTDNHVSGRETMSTMP